MFRPICSRLQNKEIEEHAEHEIKSNMNHECLNTFSYESNKNRYHDYLQAFQLNNLYMDSSKNNKNNEPNVQEYNGIDKLKYNFADHSTIMSRLDAALNIRSISNIPSRIGN